jgi:hypothetical protein
MRKIKKPVAVLSWSLDLHPIVLPSQLFRETVPLNLPGPDFLYDILFKIQYIHEAFTGR